MFTLLFRVNVLVSGWITALILAILLAFFFGQTRIYRSILQSIEATTQNRFHKLSIRWMARMTMVVVSGAALAILLSLDPVPNNGLASIFRLVQNDFWQKKTVSSWMTLRLHSLYCSSYYSYPSRISCMLLCFGASRPGETIISGPSTFRSWIFSPGHRLRPH